MSTAKTDLITQALERYKLGIEAIEKQVQREKDDLRCQVPDLMWPDDVKATRGAQLVAGVPLPPRPMISIPSLDQPVQLVLNQEKAAHLGVQIHALSEEATDDTAEVLQGLYRRIEVDSRASLARSWAYERAVKCGRGAYRILTAYADDGGHFSDQKIVIKRLLHQEAAVFDPFAQEPDWSDGRWAFITQWEPFDRYKRKYPQSTLSDYGEHEFEQLFVTAPDWVRGEGESRAVLTAEYFCLEYATRRRVQFTDGTDGYEDEAGKRQINEDIEGRDEEVPHLCWYKINAVEVLEREERDGRYIPIVPVIGRELIPFDSERRWEGIYGPNKQIAQGLNYSASGLVESAALEPKAAFDVDPEEIEGFEAFWNQANVRNFPYLPRKKFLHGQVMPPVQRVQADASKMHVNAMLVEQFQQFLHQGTAAWEAALGEQSAKAKSGRALMALQQQHEQSTSNYLDNLAEISMTYEAKVILDLIPYVYDRPGRIARLLDNEDNKKAVMLNRPFVVQNGRPMPAPPQAPDAKHYDLKKGRYGVVVSVGKAYKSRLEEGNDMLGQLFQAEPELFKLLGDIWLNFQSWPGHTQAAERMKRMLPPQLNEDDEQNIAQKAQQMAQENAMLKQQLQELGGELAKDKIKAQAQIQVAQVNADKDIALKQMDNAAKIAVARIAAAKESLDALREDHEEALALGQTQAHDAAEAAKDRMHDASMAQLQHQQAMAQGRQQAQQQAVLAEQGQDHALAQGQQGIDGTMGAQQQAAALAPQPEAGA